jgi:DNA repair protein RecO (recombination protein O)
VSRQDAGGPRAAPGIGVFFMSIHEAEAVVLRQYSLSDSDRIIILITKEFGKIRATAPGVKKPKSQFGACLEPLTRIRLEFHSREGRDLVQIRQAELLYSYLSKNPSLEKMCVFSYFSEIVNELIQDNQPNYALYRLLLASLDSGERLTRFLPLVRYFEIWCLKLSGLFPNYAYCSSCGKCVKDDGFFAWLEAGQSRCWECSQGRGLRIGKEAAAALEAIAKLPPGQFGILPLVKEAAQELERLSKRLLEMHLEKHFKSYRIMTEALQEI